MKDYDFERLAYVLRAHKKRIGAWSRLSEAIEAANPHGSAFNIGRKVLKALCVGENAKVSLKIGQLIALDNYLIASKERPLLVKGMTLLDSIAESNSVNCFVGSRKVPARRDLVVSHWDLRANTYISRSQLNQLRIETWDVNGEDHWNSVATRLSTGADIAIGSPVSNFASEILLCRMFNLPHSKKCSVTELPFFIVGSERDKRNTSAFVRNRVDATRVDPDAAKKLSKERRSLVFAGSLFATTRQSDFALLLAQRNPSSGHVQAVLLGLTGRGTYKLAQILHADRLQQTVPELGRSDRHPPVLATLYKLVLESDEEDDDFESKGIVNYSAELPPVLIHYVNGKWQFPEGYGRPN